MTEVKKRCSWRSDKVYSWQIDGLVCTRGGGQECGFDTKSGSIFSGCQCRCQSLHAKLAREPFCQKAIFLNFSFFCDAEIFSGRQLSIHTFNESRNTSRNGKDLKISFVCDHTCCIYKGIHVNTCKNISWPPLCKIPISNFLDARCHGLPYLLKWDHKTSITIWQTS